MKGLARTSEEMVDWYEEMVNKYPIVSIEDGLDENDWEGHKLLTERLGDKVSARRRRLVRYKYGNACRRN